MQEQIETFGMMLVKGILAPAFVAFLTWAAAHLGAWIQSKIRNETAASVLDRLTQLTFNVVQEIQQTVVSSLPDKANKAALLAARDQALVTLKSHLGEKGLHELMTVLGLKDDDAIVKLLLSYIESSVLSLKRFFPTRLGSLTIPPTAPTAVQPSTILPKVPTIGTVTTTQGTNR